MTINKQALRGAAKKTLNARARLELMESVFDDDGDITSEARGDIKILTSFNDITNPTTVLALLDELEAAEKRIAELEAREVKLPKPISVLHRRDFNDTHRAIYAYPEPDVNAALAAAGIGVKGE